MLAVIETKQAAYLLCNLRPDQSEFNPVDIAVGRTCVYATNIANDTVAIFQKRAFAGRESFNCF